MDLFLFKIFYQEVKRLTKTADYQTILSQLLPEVLHVNTGCFIEFDAMQGNSSG